MTVLVGWARLVMRHPTYRQVLLGVCTGAASVSVVFALML